PHNRAAQFPIDSRCSDDSRRRVTRTRRPQLGEAQRLRGDHTRHFDRVLRCVRPGQGLESLSLDRREGREHALRYPDSSGIAGGTRARAWAWTGTWTWSGNRTWAGTRTSAGAWAWRRTPSICPWSRTPSIWPRSRTPSIWPRSRTPSIWPRPRRETNTKSSSATIPEIDCCWVGVGRDYCDDRRRIGIVAWVGA